MTTIPMIPTMIPTTQNNYENLQHRKLEDLVTAHLVPPLLWIPSRPHSPFRLPQSHQITLPWLLTRLILRSPQILSPSRPHSPFRLPLSRQITLPWLLTRLLLRSPQMLSL